MQFNKSVASLAIMTSLLGGCNDSTEKEATEVIQPVTQTYVLSHTISPLNTGSLMMSPSQEAYNEGTEVEVTAEALEGYIFEAWQGDITGAVIDGDKITITLDANKTLNAVFVEIMDEATPDPIPTPETMPDDIMINEVRSTGGGFDYIELYNSGSSAYIFAEGEWAVNDLKGLQEDLEPGIVIPAGTEIAAGGFLLIATDQTSVPFGAPASAIAASEGDTDFGLGKGDTALLVHNGDIIDEANWNEGMHVETWGRLPDGGDWHTQDSPLSATPGLPNELPVEIIDANANDIVINEIVSKGRDDLDFDFVELYNKSAEPYIFAENEWELIDSDLAEGEVGLMIPAGTEIAGHGFLVLVPGELEGTELPANIPNNAILNVGEDFGLGKGETITLKYQGETHSTVSYGDFHVNSYGRIPDGGEFIELAEGEATQLYASPGHKNFMTPDMALVTTTINFTAFNDQEAALEAQGLRVFGKNADLATDVEPEYVAVSADSSTAWVSLQENNGLARVDLTTDTIDAILPLGYKDFGNENNKIDASDKDDAINLQAYANVKGIYQPDGIATFSRDGVNYVITANEGDVRDWLNGFEEGLRVEDATLSETTFPNASTLQQAEQLGRLTMTQYVTSDTAETVFDTVYSFGGRSFSIWNGMTGEQVFDSGDDLAKQAIAAEVFPDSRSDAKGVEAESVTTGIVGEKHLAFIALERADTVAVYDITDLNNVSFQQMLITSGDDAPEGVLFISADQSPNDQALLVVSNEDSGNITVYQSDSAGNFTLASRLVIEGGEGAAEISAFDPATHKLFVVNNGSLLEYPRVEVIDLASPSNIALLNTIDMSYYGSGINSLSVSNGKLATAIQATDKTHQGTVAVFDTATESLIAITKVGALPDMITFSPDGKTMITADEGEPDEDYLVDPLGTVSIIRFATPE